MLLVLAGAVSVNAQKVKVGADPAVDVSKVQDLRLVETDAAGQSVCSAENHAVN